MSVTVNGRRVEFFELDTNESFLQRVAIAFQTLPSLIEPIDIMALSPEMRIDIAILYDSIVRYRSGKSLEQQINIDQFLQESGQSWEWIPRSALLFYWYLTVRWTDHRSSALTSDFLIGMVNLDIEKWQFKDLMQLEQYGNSLRIHSNDPSLSFLNNIEDRIKQMQQDDMKCRDAFREMGNLSREKPLGFNLEKEVIAFKTPLKSDTWNLERIFANLRVHPDMPVIGFNGMYKVLAGIIAPPHWEQTVPSYIFAWLRHSDGLPSTEWLPSEQYLPFSISFTNDREDPIDLAHLRVFLDYQQLKLKTPAEIDRLKKRLIDRLRTMLPFPIGDPYNDSMVCRSSIRTPVLVNTTILSDMIMNNPLFSHFFAVSEYRQSSKSREGLFIHYFLRGNSGTCTVIPRTAKRNDPDAVSTSIPEGAAYVRIRIEKLKRTEEVGLMLRVWMRLFREYEKTKESVRAFYRTYDIADLDDTVVEVDEDESKTPMLKDLVPDVFVAQYSRKCGRQRQPRLVEDGEDLSRYQPYQYKTFPHTPGEGRQLQYICDHPENGFNYMGVIANQTENSVNYPFVPCCFKEDQDVRSGGWKNYLNYLETGSVTTRRSSEPQHRLTTHKFSAENKTSHIPDDYFIGILRSIDPDACPERTYLRLGVKPMFSFLDAVLKSVKTRRAGLELVPVPYQLEEEFERLIQNPHLVVLLQEFPGETVEAIRGRLQNIRATQGYFNPRQWIRLLELVYECQIVVVSKASRKSDITIHLPYNEMGSLSYANPAHTKIIVYEHMGAETDTDPHPRCELIIAEDKRYVNSPIFYYFISAEPTIQRFLNDCHQQCYYNLEQSILQPFQMCEFPRSFDHPEFSTKRRIVTSQWVDPYGKTRLIEVDGLVFFTSPYPPLPVPMMSTQQFQDRYRERTQQEVEEFQLRHSEMVLLSAYRSGDRIRELTYRFRHHLYTIKVNLAIGGEWGAIQQDEIARYPNARPTRQIDTHLALERLATIAVEYFIYFYSMTGKDFDDFVRNDIEIVEGHLYQLPPSPLLSLEILRAHGFVRGAPERFVADSFDTKRGLVYALHARLLNCPQEVAAYASKKLLTTYYTRLEHFITNDPTTIILNRLSILVPVDRTIHSSIPSSDRAFFQHPLVEDNALSYMVRSSDQDSVQGKEQEAAIRCLAWDRSRDLVHADEVDVSGSSGSSGCDIYLYQSSDTIDVDKADDKHGAVLMFRQDDIVHVSSIHPLR